VPNKNADDSLRRDSCQEFSLVELFVAIAVIAILVGLLLAAVTLAKHQARRDRYQSEERRLLLAWKLYSGDNNERVAANGHGTMNPSIAVRNMSQVG